MATESNADPQAGATKLKCPACGGESIRATELLDDHFAVLAEVSLVEAEWKKAKVEFAQAEERLKGGQSGGDPDEGPLFPLMFLESSANELKELRRSHEESRRRLAARRNDLLSRTNSTNSFLIKVVHCTACGHIAGVAHSPEHIAGLANSVGQALETTRAGVTAQLSRISEQLVQLTQVSEQVVAAIVTLQQCLAAQMTAMATQTAAVKQQVSAANAREARRDEAARMNRAAGALGDMLGG